MQIPMPSIPEDRPLTAEEVRLARWMLENGEPDGRDYLHQLESARIVSRCPCGCATIDLEVEGHPPARGISRRLGEFSFLHGNDESVIFIYADEGVLGGIEVTASPATRPECSPRPSRCIGLSRSKSPGSSNRNCRLIARNARRAARGVQPAACLDVESAAPRKGG